MTSPAATIRRITDLTVTFERIGPVPTRRPRTAPVLPRLTLRVPPHTAKNVDAIAGFLTTAVRAHVRMLLPTDDRFTVSISVSAGGDGDVLIDGGRNGRATIRPAN